jgi:hypothetical protein
VDDPLSAGCAADLAECFVVEALILEAKVRVVERVVERQPLPRSE